MLYVAEVTSSGFDRYGFSCRKTNLVHIDARNKKQAARLIREKCVIADLRNFQIGHVTKKA